jgi:hypothetical protein
MVIFYDQPNACAGTGFVLSYECNTYTISIRRHSECENAARARHAESGRSPICHSARVNSSTPVAAMRESRISYQHREISWAVRPRAWLVPRQDQAGQALLDRPSTVVCGLTNSPAPPGPFARPG